MRAFRFLALLVLAAVASAGPAMATPAGQASGKPKLSRVITIPYSQPCAVALATGRPFFITNCPDIEPGQAQFIVVRNGEKFVSLQIVDDSGRKVGLLFSQTYGGVYKEQRAIVCGSAARIPIDGVQYTANPAALVGSTTCPYPPTSGVMTVSLYSS